jgi:hypothetical protein
MPISVCQQSKRVFRCWVVTLSLPRFTTVVTRRVWSFTADAPTQRKEHSSFGGIQMSRFHLASILTATFLSSACVTYIAQVAFATGFCQGCTGAATPQACPNACNCTTTSANGCGNDGCTFGGPTCTVTAAAKATKSCKFASGWWCTGVGNCAGTCGAGESCNCTGYVGQSEDKDGDGVLDPTEDTNGNGVLDPGEDTNGNGNLDLAEDTNANGIIDNVYLRYPCTTP